MNGHLKTQTVTVTLPSGTPAGLQEQQVILDTEYQQCVGVAVYENHGTDGINYKIGLKDDVQTYQNQTHKEDWVVGSNVPPDQRYKTLPIPVNGSYLTIRTQLNQALTADLSYDIVFKLYGKK